MPSLTCIKAIWYVSTEAGSHDAGRSDMKNMIAATVLVAGLIGFVPLAQAQSCQDLWVERNSYYKQHGYCFKTSRAISYFGNAGCSYDNEGAVPLSPYERRRVA